MAAVQAAQLAVSYCGPTGLTAQASDRRDPCDQMLVLSWGQAAGAAGVMALLQETLPELEVLERSDQRLA